MSTRQPLKDELAAKMLSDKLAESHLRMDRIKRLDNKQLAEELLEKVWAQTRIYTEQYDLLEEAIERLKPAQHSVQPPVLCAGHSTGSFIKDGVCQTCGLPAPHSG